MALSTITMLCTIIFFFQNILITPKGNFVPLSGNSPLFLPSSHWYVFFFCLFWKFPINGILLHMYYKTFSYKILYKRTSLMAQWMRICLPTEGTWVWCLVWETSTCLGATKPVHHNYWASVLQLLKFECPKPVHKKRSHHNEKPGNYI